MEEKAIYTQSELDYQVHIERLDSREGFKAEILNFLNDMSAKIYKSTDIEDVQNLVSLAMEYISKM